MHYRKGKSTSKATIDECKDAEQFRKRFGGDFTDPATRPKPPAPRTHRADISLEALQRNGRRVNCGD